MRQVLSTESSEMAMESIRAIAGRCGGRVGVICLLLCSVVGCDSGSSLVPVTGTIMVDGKPAEGAVLLFHPSSSGVASVSSAVAKADGSFAPVTDSEPGMPVGSYKVSVSWPDPTVKPTERQLMMGDAEPGPDLLQGKYVSRDKSKLTAEITPTTTAIPAIELSTK